MNDEFSFTFAASHFDPCSEFSRVVIHKVDDGAFIAIGLAQLIGEMKKRLHYLRRRAHFQRFTNDAAECKRFGFFSKGPKLCIAERTEKKVFHRMLRSIR